MSEMLITRLLKIEFVKSGDRGNSRPVARVTITVSASIIEESQLTFVLPWTGDLAVLQEKVDTTIRDLGKTLANHPVIPAKEAKRK